MRFPPRPDLSARSPRSLGFTLVELMITLTVLALIMGVLTTVMFSASRSKMSTSNRLETSQASRVAVDMMARDLRTAGYGADLDYVASPQPAVAYVDSLQLLINANLQPYPDSGSVHKAPLAYSPTGNPRPFPLNGTSWAPPIRYRTGAELVRWTLDINNDGQVDGGDIAAADGVDAQRTSNPDDYVLVRQVYGDSTGNVAGNNGPTTERVALVRKSGGTIPPMFTVYMKGMPTPWDWASGPVPAGQLKDIDRVVINVVAPSGRPDWRGRYAETTIKTEVYSSRNVPNFGATKFTVDGYVFNDLNKDGDKDAGEPGLSGIGVALGTYLTASTNASGYFLFSAAAGTYVLKHTPPGNFLTLTQPDSFIVTVGPATTRSFADTIVAGGWVTALVWEDLDGDNIKDANEPWREDEVLTFTPGGAIEYTDSYGTAKFFAKVGAYSMSLSVPDSFTCTTSNPVSGSMANGDSAKYLFALNRQNPGKFQGLVWQDKNGNGAVNGGEGGVGNVWVSVRRSNSTSVITYEYTGSDGKFEIEVPSNDPPATDAYTIEIIPPSGYYPTTPLEVGGLFVKSGKTVTGVNFGINSFQRIALTANRVLSLASGDLIEKDWTGTKTQDARQDPDLVLGADAAGSDQLSVWFNQYNGNPIFNTTRSYSRAAPNSVLSLAADSLNEDAAPASGRLDLVTGTAYAAAGNFFVWYVQGTSGNEGYFGSSYSSAYRTSDNGDVQAVVTANVAGGAASDIVVGTKSPTAGQGTVEIWQSDGAATPTFTRLETYPPAGNIPGHKMGEVTSLQLSNLRKNGSGKHDMVVGTKTSATTGQLMIFDGDGGGGDLFKIAEIKDISNGAVTSLTCADYNLDNRVDVVIGVQKSGSTGEIQFWKQGTDDSSLQFSLDTTIVIPGYPLSLASGDLGSLANPDIVVGFRTNDVGYGGGVAVYYMDGGSPSLLVDPSGGTVVNMVPTVIVRNFNYGVKPSLAPTPWNPDIAAGVKSGATTGSLQIFVR